MLFIASRLCRHLVPRRLYSTTSHSSYDAQAFAYCAAQLRKYDYESYLWVVQLPKALRAAVLALRAFNIEVALIPSNTKEANLQALRYQWWRDSLNACYQGHPPDHPVLQSLAQILQDTHLTRYRLQQLVAVRQLDSQAGATPFATVDDMERYAEGTSGQLLYLQLEAADAFDQAAHHTAMHLGKAVGMVRLLQGVPFHAGLGRCYLPAHVCAARGVSVGAIRKGQPSEELKDAVLDVASVAKGHLDEARGACESIPRHARPLMLSAVGVGEYLRALEMHDFDVFSPALQAVATRPTLRYQLQLKWHVLRGTF